ncbi:DUF3999 family protein [Dyella telluris]|uniref:DUF3999 family protein n=1 Tax=Dyella telluris TaxID=2763498 RepID=A0A7G8Q418_9GAMM|nr:DUF3999 family protein [Dyella telluris]QNK01526.1 DUF3999 family protein [Dyella telluris]
MRLDVRWIALALMLPVAAARADSNVDYAYAFALDTHATAEAYRVVLTPEVYASANPSADLGDMIVVNALGKPVPFALMPVAPPLKHDFETEVRLLALPVAAANSDSVKVERNASGGIVISQDGRGATAQRPKSWLIDAGREVNIDGIALVPASIQQDFQLHVSVEGSNNLRDWQLLSDDASLTRVHNDQDQVEQLSVELGGNAPARYYRLRLTDGEVDWSTGHAPTVTLTGSYTDAGADRASQLQWLDARVSGQAASDYDFELPATLPVEAVALALPATNSAARVHVLVQGRDAASWTEVSALDLVRAAGRKGDATATINMRSVSHLRVHSDTPLSGAPSLRVGWLPPQYVFLPEGSAPYRLLVGSYSARRGEYPVDEAIGRLRGSHGEDWQPPVAALGARKDEAGAVALEAPKVPYDWTRPLLWVVLVVGALGVAWMAFSLLRQGRRDEQ